MKLLFVCTHNRCRSIIAEAVCNHLGGEAIEARSAGSQPSGEVHPLSLRYLQEAGINTGGLRSQSWDEHEDWQPDVVITVCDQAAGEQCPLWFGRSLRVHWGLEDPSRLEGSEEEVATAFRHTIDLLRRRCEQLLAAEPTALDGQQRLALLKRLGEY
ncbi:arsenate reductase ArsC [Seongchinamella sediminis]|uniref:Arsenate reductase ArsC n=1 Tax=Seongchinamella sediminis TaxID=2283635 RepID=A0A3L7E1J1_9GAMM|nr:arsenate reductase ArsC [Seongchinamella sediminis]RLQ22151.1 arsenate reductase ArsC [Seongchinamella sediminis]